MKNAFSSTFRSYACENDTICAEINGLIVTARIVRDDYPDRPDEHDDGFWPSKNPNDAGFCPPEKYEEDMKKAQKIMTAWKNGEWFYCGIVLSVETENGIIISDHAASLWGIECNFPGAKNEYLTEVANELLPEALENAKEKIRQMPKI